MSRPKKALEQGDTWRGGEIISPGVGESTEQAEKAQQAAKRPTSWGSLAESRIDYGQADKYYRQAVQLQPDNPRYLNAAGNLATPWGIIRRARNS